MMIRAIIQQVVEGLIKRFTASGRPGETIVDREYFQHWGFTSIPLAGAEGIVIHAGNHFVMIASDDRRYRLAIDEGEVALYDDLGQKAHLTRNGIEAVSPLRISADAPEINLGGLAREGMHRFIDERFRALFNNHVHQGVYPGGGNSGVPTATLEYADHATDITRGI